jgi:hypothetical protein
MKLQLGKGASVDTDLCSLEELIAHKAVLDEQIISIDSQIQFAIAHRHETGQYADPHWMTNAKIALKQKRRAQQQLMVETSRRRKAQRQIEHNQERPLSDYFVEICKERMPADLFDLLVEEALQRKLIAVNGQKQEAAP